MKVAGSPGDASGSGSEDHSADVPYLQRSLTGGHSLPEVNANQGLLDEARKLVHSQKQQCE